MRGNSKGMSEDISWGSSGDIILDSGDNGGRAEFLVRGRLFVFCILLHNLLPLGVEPCSAEGGVYGTASRCHRWDGSDPWRR